MGAQGKVKVFSSMICTLILLILFIHALNPKIQTRVSVHTTEILVHLAVLLTSRYETKLSRDEINWFLNVKKE